MQLSGKNIAYHVYNAGLIPNTIEKAEEKGMGAENWGWGGEWNEGGY